MSRQSGEGSGLVEVLAMLRRRVGILVLSVALVLAAAIVFSLLQEKQYTASASLLVRHERLSDELFGGATPVSAPDPQRLLETNLRLVGLDAVAERAAARIGGGITATEVAEKVEVDATEDSDVISIEATSVDPKEAASIANGFGQAFLAFRERADREQVSDAQLRLERQLQDPTITGPRRAALESRADELRTLADLQTGGVELVQEAEAPSSPSSPNLRQNALIGGFAGLLLGLALVLVLEQIDRRLIRPEELQQAFDLPLVGAIPESGALRNGEFPSSVDGRASEAFRMLRANLRYFDVRREIHSVLVTSAGPKDGKTTIALNLAATTAQSGARVLLVEADLHRRTLASILGLEQTHGLTTLLRDQALVTLPHDEGPISLEGERDLVIDDVVQTVSIDEGSEVSPSTLDAVVAGPPAPNPSELLESDAMAAVLAAAERRYDLVVVDTPPVGMISDPIPLLEKVSGVLVVARLGGTTRDTVARFKSQLDTLNVSVLGVVANQVQRRRGYTGYDYYAYRDSKKS